MMDKDWLGADLIFDLDGDHLPEFLIMIFQIDFGNSKTTLTLGQILHPEFGFEEKYIQTSFRT